MKYLTYIIVLFLFTGCVYYSDNNTVKIKYNETYEESYNPQSEFRFWIDNTDSDTIVELKREAYSYNIKVLEEYNDNEYIIVGDIDNDKITENYKCISNIALFDVIIPNKNEYIQFTSAYCDDLWIKIYK